MGLIDDVGVGPIGIDTCVFIYLIEDHPSFGPVIGPLFEAIDRGELTAVTSAVTLLEVLVVPYRSGDIKLARRYEDLLTRSSGIELIDLDRNLIRAAAQLRAVNSGKTPDALQIAAAMRRDCTSFLTNDRSIRTPASLRVRQIGDYTSAS